MIEAPQSSVEFGSFYGFNRSSRILFLSRFNLELGLRTGNRLHDGTEELDVTVSTAMGGRWSFIDFGIHVWKDARRKNRTPLKCALNAFRLIDCNATVSRYRLKTSFRESFLYDSAGYENAQR